MFPTNTITAHSYILTGVNSTTTVLDLNTTGTLLYSGLEKPVVTGEIKILVDGVIVDHLDGDIKTNFYNIPFHKLELARVGLGNNDETFATFSYLPYSSTTATSASSTVLATFTYGEVINSVFLFLLFAIGFYKLLK